MSAGARERQEQFRRPTGEYGTQPGVNAPGAISLVQTPVRYSFIEERQRQEDEYEARFDGMPKRFFSTDLETKRSLDNLAKAASTPQDETLDFETISELAGSLGITGLTEVSDKTRGFLGKNPGEHAWVGRVGDAQVIISSHRSGSAFARYTFRRNPGDPAVEGRGFYMLDARSLAGAARIQHVTGSDLYSHFTQIGTREERVALLEELSATKKSLMQAQNEGRNFQLNKKYVSDRKSEIATAFSDKKHPDTIHQRLMSQTQLNDSFDQVEIDNDVSEADWKEFEEAWADTKDKLPPIPEDRKPKLRIRYLGKHRAAGLFSPHHNTVAIDVHTSGSFVHEMGHYYDHMVYSSPSLSKGFSSLAQRYSATLDVPADRTGKYGRDYYTTPTEIHSRLFEVYAHERLGVRNRMLDPSRFSRFDYAPIMNNPGLKEDAFAFFDKMFA